MSKEYLFADYTELIRKHREEAQAMAERLAMVKGYERRAERMANCESYTSGMLCPKCHTFHTVKASLCRDRLCPNCGWALSRRRAAAVLQAVEDIGSWEPIEVIHVVLTLKHENDMNPAEQIDDLQAAISRLMRRKRMKENTIGSVRSVEIKKGKNGFHPHIHMLMIVNADYFHNPIKQRELVTMWREAARMDYNPIVWIKKAYDGKNAGKDLKDAIYECVKYTIKTSEWKTMKTNDLVRAASAIFKRRLFTISGARLRAAYDRAVSEQSKQDEILESPYCKSCGTKKVYATIGGKER